jgi:cbb3-type cytochrome oxidase subunit 3
MAEYNWSGLIGSITTVVAFVAFVAIVAWAYSARRKAAFDAAANEPFALPDDMVGRGDTSAAGPSRGRPSERGDSQARSARPLAVAAADTPMERVAEPSGEAARCAPSGGSVAAKAASVEANQ